MGMLINKKPDKTIIDPIAIKNIILNNIVYEKEIVLTLIEYNNYRQIISKTLFLLLDILNEELEKYDSCDDKTMENLILQCDVIREKAKILTYICIGDFSNIIKADRSGL